MFGLECRITLHLLLLPSRVMHRTFRVGAHPFRFALLSALGDNCLSGVLAGFVFGKIALFLPLRLVLPDFHVLIAGDCGVSVQWLLRNHPAAPLVDPFGNRYTKNHYLRARSLRRDPRLLGLILGARTTVRMQLLQNYAKARALFDRPEMRQHFLRYIAELELLRGRFEDKALYSEGTTAGDLIVEEAKLLATDSLFPGVIADARKCQQAIKTARERKKMREESLGALEPASESSEPVRQTKAQRGRELVRKRIRESVAERHK